MYPVYDFTIKWFTFIDNVIVVFTNYKWLLKICVLLLFNGQCESSVTFYTLDSTIFVYIRIKQFI